MRRHVDVGGHLHGQQGGEAAALERYFPRVRDKEYPASHAATAWERVQVIAVDRREVDVRVREGEVELSGSDRLRALPEQGAWTRCPALERSERGVVLVNDARAGRGDGIRRGDCGGERVAEGGEAEVGELRSPEHIGEASGACGGRPERGEAREQA